MDQIAAALPAELLERGHECSRVRAALRGVGKRAGRVVVIEAAPGMGKSRLLEVARASGPELGVQVLSARASELEKGFPFGVARQLFERSLIEADSDERARWLAGAGALAADVLIAEPISSPTTNGGAPTEYQWQHGLYWLASNLSADSPLILVVDDLQWCDAPSARALAFIARRLEEQPLGLILATRPLDPVLAPESATLVSGSGAEVLRPASLTAAAVAALVSARLADDDPHDEFVCACIEVTGGNPFLVGELLDEAAARELRPTAAAANDVATMVPRGVANAVLLRLARLAPAAGALARAASVIGDGAQVTDVGLVAGVEHDELEAAVGALVSAAVIEAGISIRFAHPILRAAVYGDLSAAERERLHHGAATILRDRGATAVQVAAQVMHTQPAADLEAVALLRRAARDVLSMGDAAGAATLLARALAEPPADDERTGVLLELGQARARAGAPDAIAPLSEIVERGDDSAAIVAAAIELSGLLFFSGRAVEGARVLRRAQERLPGDEPAREQLDVAMLSASYTSASARREAEPMIADLRDPGGPAESVLQATIMATLAMNEVMYLRSAATGRDLAHRALAAGVPLDLHRGGNWAILAIAALALTEDYDACFAATDDLLARARERGAANTVATASSLRAVFATHCGDLAGAEADAQVAIGLAPDLVGAEFVVLAVAAAVLAGLDRGATPDSLRRLVDDTGIRYDTEFMASGQLRYASGVLRAAAGNHEAAIEELLSCGLEHPGFGGQNPAAVPWRSMAALSLAALGRDEEARELAADEVQRAQSFGAARPIGMALRVQALVGPASSRATGLEAAVGTLADSPARVEHARALLDLGATLRAAGKRTAARQPLHEALLLATRCGAAVLERRAREELAAIGIRPRTTERSGADALTPSERRVVELAATGPTNREIAQALFVTEKTVETHLGRAFRKLDVSSRRQLPDVLTSAAP
jgi:DNA-binding CsgD family transcriptional regulator